MAEPDWDRRYRDGFYGGSEGPHELVRRFWPVIPKGRVIDVAMGSGRNALFLAGKGFGVCGIERSAEAIRIARGALDERAAILRGDAERLPFKRESAEGDSRLLFSLKKHNGRHRNGFKKGWRGYLRNFLEEAERDRQTEDPEYLLDDGELISFFESFDLFFYEETLSVTGGRRRAVAKLVGRKR